MLKFFYIFPWLISANVKCEILNEKSETIATMMNFENERNQMIRRFIFELLSLKKLCTYAYVNWNDLHFFNLVTRHLFVVGNAMGRPSTVLNI